MSAWAVGVTVSATVASARLTAKVFTDSSPISARACLNIERDRAETRATRKIWSSQRPASGSIDYRGFLALGDGAGQLLLVADALQLLQGLVESRTDLGAGREGGRQLAHALDDADALVMHRAVRVAAVVGHPVEDRGQHGLEHRARHVRSHAAVHANAKAEVPVTFSVEDNLVRIGEHRGV